MKLVSMIIIFIFLTSCTQIKYNRETKDVHYLSVLQKKNLTVTITKDPKTDIETIVLTYNTDSDPAVQIFQAAVTAALQVAKAAPVK